MEHEDMAAAFVAQAQERIRGTFIELVGIRLLSVDMDHAVAEMAFAPQLQQLTGIFHAGALISLADTAATYASLYWAGIQFEQTGQRFPLTIQLSTNLLRNTNRGIVRAEARPVHRGRSTIVVETRLHDDQERLLMVVTTTHLLVASS
jgi:uncharacterized protein (TIGR00369 family)